MKEAIITDVLEQLKDAFTPQELQKIESAVLKSLNDKEVIEVVKTQPQTNEEALKSFLAAKKIEGCSPRSILFYDKWLCK